MVRFEDSRNEFKEILNDKLEREIVAFLNSNGGNLYIGISDDGKFIGVDGNIDKLQLEIKDRIKTNISPITLGLFDINIEEYDAKNIIHISIARGKEKPYYLKKKGMIPEGCFVRVGNSTEQINQEQINDMFARRTRNSLRNIVAPSQNLKFSQLKIYYEEKGYTINDNFLSQLGLVMDDGRYNYVAYLLSDNNNISIKVATYSGIDAYDLIQNEEYGYCCLIKATKKVIDKFDIINKTFSKITSAERKEIKMFDAVAIREAVVNAIVHNMWEVENPPKFEIFADHVSITSTGGLPQGVNEDEFLKGYSFPRHPELMRVFKDLDLVEQLGTGIVRILKVYDKSVYEFSENFIRVNFMLNDYSMLNQVKENEDSIYLTELQRKILDLIKLDNTITQKEMCFKLGVGRTTITSNLRYLKEQGCVQRKGSDKTGYWRINGQI